MISTLYTFAVLVLIGWSIYCVVQGTKNLISARNSWREMNRLRRERLGRGRDL